MQEPVINLLQSANYDKQLHRAWQLMKHHAQSMNVRPKVRFASENLPAYYRSEVTSVAQKKSGYWLIKTSLPGLSGNQGVLQRSVNKQALNALFDEGNYASLDFYNVFNSRYYRLYCASEIKHSMVDLLEEETFEWNTQNYQKSVSDLLANLTGVLEKSPLIPNSHFIQYTSLIGMKLTSPLVLKELLQDYFQYDFEIEHSPVEYQPLTACSLTRIGLTGQNQSLGMGALIGQNAAMVGQKLLVKICPANYRQYQEINKNPTLTQSIYQMMKIYLGVNVNVSLHMKVNGKYLPGLKLAYNPKAGLKLGESAWMEGKNSVTQYVEMPLKAS
ncbi:hypothetical protein MACH09_35660 [Vibrio sp. MACH09]|uniref:type VI secretion system baseplate subunit TssG n=1 Tax=Vibrio sp. MACH09 TaxID=3025122 RepID=UPI002792AE6C|nr:type VI secretion system baseplate subunit TssG [Vibrio sp. MACH09]GLO63058.1 hypothetical protein MACH09_35660 [Vibrio sp. MACH09]